VATSAIWEPPFFTPDYQLSGGPFANPVHCSRFGNDTCVLMQKSPNFTHVNFTLGPSTACGASVSDVKDGTIWAEQMECPAGDFAVLVGVWFSRSRQDRNKNAASKLWHTVDCQIQYGTTSVQQNGSGVPELDRHSFAKSTAPLRIVRDPSGEIDYRSSAGALWRMNYFMMAQYGFTGTSPPFTFAVDNERVRGSLTLAQALLGVSSSSDEPDIPLMTNRNDAEKVAKDLEASFDLTTLLAFATAPHAASLNITTTTSLGRWSYDARVLPVLALPLLATLLVCSVYWRVYGDEIVIGYNPLEIARRTDEITVASRNLDEEGTSDSKVVQLTLGRGTYNKLKEQVSE
jgi:hypothetical protein